MLNSFDLTRLKNAAVDGFPKDSLADLRDIKIDAAKPLQDRMNDFLGQVKNPYLFKVGDVGVKVSFISERSFAEAIGSAVAQGIVFRTDLG